MNVGIMTAYPEPIGFNRGVLQFCQLVQAPRYGVKPVLIAMTRRPNKENALMREARSLGIQVETLHEEFRYDPRVVPSLCRLIDRLDLQLLDAQTFKPLATCLAARNLRPQAALVSWVHGYTQENLKIRLFGVAERYLHRHADRVICVSNSFAELLGKKGIPAGKLQVIQNALGDGGPGVGEHRGALLEELGISHDAPIVGAIGRLSPEKGHTLLIKAFSRIVKVVPQARLLLVGDGPCMSDLRQEANDLGLGDSVLFTGFRSDGRRFFNLMDVMVLPSFAEGLPYVLLEAMIDRVPVVASAVGEVPEVLEGGRLGRLITPGDVDAMAREVTALLADVSGAERVADEARASVLSRYSPAARTQAIVDTYRQAVQARAKS